MNTEVSDEFQKRKKIVKTAIIVSVILFVIILLLMIYFYILESKKLKFVINTADASTSLKVTTTSVDGEEVNKGMVSLNNQNLDLFVVKDETYYFNIKSICEILGYDYYKGEYNPANEDSDKCYIVNEGEYVSFANESNIIKKQFYNSDKKTDTSSDTNSSNNLTPNIEKYTVEESIIKIEDNLYAPVDAIKIGFNVKLVSNGNTINLYSLSNLVKVYDEYAKQNGYDGISEDFKNKRALVNDLIVVQENGKYGIYALDSNSENNTGKEIINTRYDSLEYVGNINQFIAKYSGKFGILSPEKEELTLPIEYDSLEFLSSEELMLYIVSKNNKYGVISGNGDKIVPVEFERIGLNKLDDFSEQNITNPYILFDKYIVVYSNEKYGLYSVDGTETTMETVYESLGCIAKDTAQFVVDQNRNVQMSDLYNTLIIDARSGENVVQGIVVKYQGHYGVVGLDGKVLIPTEWDTIFFLKNKEGLTYYLASTEKAVTINQLLGI